MKFFTCVAGRPGSEDGPKFLVIAAATAFDAKAFALRELGPEGLIVHQTGEHAVESVELQWVGTDYGPNPDRHLEVRRRSVRFAEPVGPWGEWSNA